MLVRAEGLADTMSRYLVRRIEDNPAIVLYTRPKSSRSKERASSNVSGGATTGPATMETGDIRHVFVMAGAVPNTRWLERCVALDEKGFIKTGPDLLATIWRRRGGR